MKREALSSTYLLAALSGMESAVRIGSVGSIESVVSIKFGVALNIECEKSVENTKKVWLVKTGKM